MSMIKNENTFSYHKIFVQVKMKFERNICFVSRGKKNRFYFYECVDEENHVKNTRQNTWLTT